jgi:nucleoside-diphosphate-sugar epimerase
VKVLVIGGCGYVGRLFVPYLAARHAVLVFDLAPDADVVGDATDLRAVRSAMDGVDAVVHCAMAPGDGSGPLLASFDVNVSSVYLALHAAHEAGVPHAVYISSMSVYDDVIERPMADESIPPDATDLYGLTKRLGEQVCEAAARRWGLSVNALRLTWPTPDDQWPAWARWDPPEIRRTAAGVPIDATAASDLAAAIDAALSYRNGFRAFTISGDRSGRWGTASAQELLGWRPTFGFRDPNGS